MYIDMYVYIYVYIYIYTYMCILFFFASAASFFWPLLPPLLSCTISGLLGRYIYTRCKIHARICISESFSIYAVCALAPASTQYLTNTLTLRNIHPHTHTHSLSPVYSTVIH